MAGIFDAISQYLAGTSDGLKRGANEAGPALAGLLSSIIQNTGDRYKDAVYGRIPEGGATLNDADQWLDKDGKPLENPQPATVRGNVLPLEKQRDGTVNWSTPGLLDALPGLGFQSGRAVAPAAEGGEVLGTYGGTLSQTANFNQHARARELAEGFSVADQHKLDTLRLGNPAKMTQAEHASLADLTAREAEMQKFGKDPEAIRQATGWFKSPAPESRWTYEIGDQKAAFPKPLDDVIRDKAGGSPYVELGLRSSGVRLDDVLQHDDLFKAYPELRKVRVIPGDRLPSNVLGGYGANIISLQTNGRTQAEIFSTLMHEISHAVADLEQTHTGGAPRDMPWAYAQEYNAKFKELREEREARNNGGVPLKPGSPTNMSNADLKEITETAKHDIYLRLKGEVEARDVAARRTFDDFQRQQIPPYREALDKDGYLPSDIIARDPDPIPQGIFGKPKPKPTPDIQPAPAKAGGLLGPRKR